MTLLHLELTRRGVQLNAPTVALVALFFRGILAFAGGQRDYGVAGCSFFAFFVFEPDFALDEVLAVFGALFGYCPFDEYGRPRNVHASILAA